MPDGFDVLQAKVAQLQGEFNGQAARRRLEAVARQTKPDVDDAVRSDLGDLSMSGWRRNNPYDIRGRYDILSDHQFEVNPERKARGPMRVLEYGRGTYAAGDTRSSGFRTRKKDGVRVEKRRRVKRNVKGTQGKGTWTDATELMSKRVPERVDEQVQKAIGKFFKKG